MCVCVYIESLVILQDVCVLSLSGNFGEVLDKRSSTFLVLVLGIVSVPHIVLLNNILND